MNAGRWIVVVVVLLVVAGLIAYARGPDHRRGDEIGRQASGDPPVAVAHAVGGSGV
jgi:hypothetical protein